MIEYLSADFQAATDFKVGEAIRYITDVKGLRVCIGQQASDNPLKDEQQLKRELVASGYKLLNDRLGYNYRTADHSQERAKIHVFCEELISSADPIN